MDSLAIGSEIPCPTDLRLEYSSRRMADDSGERLHTELVQVYFHRLGSQFACRFVERSGDLDLDSDTNVLEGKLHVGSGIFKIEREVLVPGDAVVLDLKAV